MATDVNVEESRGLYYTPQSVLHSEAIDLNHPRSQRCYHDVGNYLASR